MGNGVIKRFEDAQLPAEAYDAEATMNKFGITREEAEMAVASFAGVRVVMNDEYQVNMSSAGSPFGDEVGKIICLSIKRRDKAPIHDWRDLQAIKNQLVGPDCEAFELYPAESRKVDTTNQYFLWVFLDPQVRLPVGFRERLSMDAHQVAGFGARQRPFAKEDA